MSEIPEVSEIPEDIWETAKSFLHAPISDVHGNSLFFWLDSLAEEKALRVLARAILAERKRHGWQNIDTVSKDGTIVDLWHVKGFRVVDEWWDAEDGWTGGWSEDAFTYWMKSPIANP